MSMFVRRDNKVNLICGVDTHLQCSATSEGIGILHNGEAELLRQRMAVSDKLPTHQLLAVLALAVEFHASMKFHAQELSLVV